MRKLHCSIRINKKIKMKDAVDDAKCLVASIIDEASKEESEEKSDLFRNKL